MYVSVANVLHTDFNFLIMYIKYIASYSSISSVSKLAAALAITIKKHTIYVLCEEVITVITM